MYTTTMALMLASVSTSLHLPPGLLSAVCYVESKHDAKAIHKDDGTEDSIGLCQMHESTARLMGFRGPKVDLMKAKINALYAAKYLSHQLHRYKGSVKKAIASYNAGTYRVDSNGQVKNNLYVAKVMVAWRLKK